ncbi:MAG: FAD-binding protein [Gammaproteobacteria bacterium]|nr:FAD-binding protein [Gammaproteobacteria bacterium]
MADRAKSRTTLPTAVQRALRDAVGRDRVLTEPEVLHLYSGDDGPRRCPPLAVVFPTHHDDVAAIVQIANSLRLPIVARGGGSGNVGGAVPVPGSIVVSFECMRRVLEFHPDERVLIAEAGVPTGELDALARTHGLFYPPDPGSAPYCRLGGNLATNAAGPRAVKYGVTRDYVLGVRAVAGSGRTLNAGGRTSKRTVGYDLTRLLIGSEGTLALITEATLRLLPAPTTVGTLRACYASSTDACAAVARVMSQPIVPSACELLDAAAIAAIQRHGAAADLPAGTRAMLIVEADGDADAVARALGQLHAALAGHGLLELRTATDANEVAALWKARRALSPAIKIIAPLKINEDVVVPVPKLAELIDTIEALAAEYRLPIVSFGHAGNGNLHVNLMVHPDDAAEMARAELALASLFAKVLALNGTISGEHGIGYAKRAFVPLEIAEDTLALMRELKAVFDPKGILNPGKIFPDN